LSDLRPIGNPLALHAGRSPRDVTQAPLHIHVMAYAALKDLFCGTRLPRPRRLGHRVSPFRRSRGDGPCSSRPAPCALHCRYRAARLEGWARLTRRPRPLRLVRVMARPGASSDSSTRVDSLAAPGRLTRI
jgi:hypothetical protein